MLLTTLQLTTDRPHLGRVEVAARVGKPDIAAHIAQVVRELAKDAEVPGFRKGKAPLKRVQEYYLKDVRARARARLVESIQEAVSEQVGKQYRVLGSPKPEYDEDARVDELAGFEVKLAYDIDPMSDKQVAPEGLVPKPDTGEPGAGPPGAKDLGMGGPGGRDLPPGVPSGPRPPTPPGAGAPSPGPKAPPTPGVPGDKKP